MGIGEKGVVGIQGGGDLGGMAGPPDAKRADAEFDPGLLLFDGGINLFDKGIDVEAAPIAPGKFSAGLLVSLPHHVVRKIGRLVAPGGIGIEVVVQVDAINVIATDHIHNHAQGIAARAGVGRVEHDHLASGADQFGMGVGHEVPGGGGFVIARAHAEGIEPGVEFQAAPVAFGDGESQGIIIRLGGEAHFAGEKGRPRLDFGIVKRVAAGADLEEDGVQMEEGGAVEDGEEFGFLLAGVQAGMGGPIEVLECRHPEAAEFALGRGRRPGQGGAGRGGFRQRGGGARRRVGATREEQESQPHDLAQPFRHQWLKTNQ